MSFRQMKMYNNRKKPNPQIYIHTQKNNSQSQFSASEANQIRFYDLQSQDSVSKPLGRRRRGMTIYSESKTPKKKFDSIEKLSINSEQSHRIQQKPKRQECSICFSDFQPWLLQQFSTCKHKFCTKCIQQHITNQLEKFKPVRCLAQDCPIILDFQSPHIRSLNINQQQKYYKVLIFAHTINSSQLKLCTTKDCEGFVCLSQEVAKCAFCQVILCKKCLAPVHKGQCYQKEVAELQDKFKFKRCQKCKMMVEKNLGCNHMTCRCQYQFCYLCGGQWGANHVCRQPAQNRSPRIEPPARPPQAVNHQQIPMPSALISNNPRANNLQNRTRECNFKRILKILFAIFLILFIAIIDIIWGVSIALIFVSLAFIYSIMVSLKSGFDHFKDDFACWQIIIGNIVLLLFCIGRQIGRSFCTQMRLYYRASSPTDTWLFPLSNIIWQAITQ